MKLYIVKTGDENMMVEASDETDLQKTLYDFGTKSYTIICTLNGLLVKKESIMINDLCNR
jgi:hypothetical protein